MPPSAAAQLSPSSASAASAALQVGGSSRAGAHDAALTGAGKGLHQTPAVQALPQLLGPC